VLQSYRYFALTCPTYLSFEEFAEESLLDDLNTQALQITFRYGYKNDDSVDYRMGVPRSFPLLLFAAEYWSQFIHDADTVISSEGSELWNAFCAMSRSVFRLKFLCFWCTCVRSLPGSSRPDCNNFLAGSETNALIIAAHFGLEQFVYKLVDSKSIQNIDFQEKTSRGGRKTALSIAVSNGYENIARFPIQRGADINFIDEEGKTLLDSSVGATGHINVVRLLVEKGINVEIQGGIFRHQYYSAAFHGHTEIAKFLIEGGADVNAEAGDYGNALQAAAANGYETIVELLVENDADINTQIGRYGNALQAAIEAGHTEVAEFLVEKGANVNAEGGYYGTALQAAAAKGYRTIVKLLVESGANIGTIGGEYTSALWAAATCSRYRGDHGKVIRFLLESGANSIPHGKYDNSLQAASEEGRENIVRELLRNGADGKYWDNELYRGTALSRAVVGGHVSIVDLLIEHGANPNHTRGQHGTPLQWAISSGHEGIVRSLVKAGADMSSTTVLQMAAWKLHESILNSLNTQICANNFRDNSVYIANALHKPDVRNAEAIIRCFVENGANPDFFLNSSNLTSPPCMNSPHLEFEVHKFVWEFIFDLISKHRHNPAPRTRPMTTMTKDVEMELF
jgi:ankyrin repeat protein